MNQKTNTVQKNKFLVNATDVAFKLMPDIEHQLKDVIDEFEQELIKCKGQLDTYDASERSRKKRIYNYMSKRDDLFGNINQYFQAVWELISTSDNRDSARSYFKKRMLPHFQHAEINQHIVDKPLGYAGDFRVIEFLYDYQEDFLGTTSYKMFLNDYTVTIPIATSTKARKDYFKSSIKALIDEKNDLKIMSIGSGSCREIIELISENKVNRSTQLTCLDFDQRALEVVNQSVNELSYDKRKSLSLRLCKVDIKTLLNPKRAKEMLGVQDYIYSAGLFDYFENKIAGKVIRMILSLLKPNGTATVCNVNAEDDYMRAYYEILGDWVFFHRTKDEMLQLFDSVECRYWFETVRVSPNHTYVHMKNNSENKEQLTEGHQKTGCLTKDNSPTHLDESVREKLFTYVS